MWIYFHFICLLLLHFFCFSQSSLGHISASRLKFLVSIGLLGTLESHDISNCSGCKLEKKFALPFKKSISSSLAHFNLMHSDVWGPSPVSAKGGSNIISLSWMILIVSLGSIL